MLKTLIVLAAALATGVLPVAPEMVPDGIDALAVAVDGQLVDTLGLVQEQDGELIVPLRGVCDALGATEVTWDAAENCARVTAPGLSMWIPFDREYIEANGRCRYVPGGVDVVSGYCLVPLDLILWAFGAEAETDGMFVEITSTGQPPEAGDDFYDSEDLYWLSHIIYAESGNQPLVGQIAVGNVVINRSRADGFPDTVKEVIFDRRYGVQFTPAYSGSIDMTPSRDSVAAAKLALEGVDTSGGALYFASRRAAQTCWASRHCDVVAEIAGHVFFGEEGEELA